ncbi:MAG: hypothetical protein Q4A93_04495 [Actinomycetota bacterium]|nr:hypothetical protein [Actinomycetota bacterium]
MKFSYSVPWAQHNSSLKVSRFGNTTSRIMSTSEREAACSTLLLAASAYAWLVCSVIHASMASMPGFTRAANSSCLLSKWR